MTLKETCCCFLVIMKDKVPYLPVVTMLLVEECYGRFCLHPDCLLLAVGCCSWGINLAMHVPDEFAKEIVVFSTIMCIRLL